MADSASPAALGFRMPAEWEPHHATWIGWPHNAGDWPGKFAPIPWVYGEIVRKLVPGEVVRILVNSAAHERQARRVLERVGVDSARIEFFRLPTNRGWTRDYGPLFVRRERPRPEVAIARFRFNAWAKYADWKRDDQVPERVAKRLGLRLLRARAGDRDVVLEGGSIDVNGRGTLLTTEQCLLDPAVQVRNPGLPRAELERALREPWCCAARRIPATRTTGRCGRIASGSRGCGSRTARKSKSSPCRCLQRFPSRASGSRRAMRISTSPTTWFSCLRSMIRTTVLRSGC